MKNKVILSAVLLLFSYGCNSLLEDGHNQQPYDRLSPDNAFRTEGNLELYSFSFYKILPSFSAIYSDDQTSDIMQRRDFWTFIVPNGYSSDQSSGWSWSDLRNINYFIEQLNNLPEDHEISEEALNHYMGLARFFRAWFYFDKVIRFGDVPWYDKVLAPDDEEGLKRPRDPRSLVMDNVLEDLDFAADHVRDEKDNSASTITKWAVLSFKSRVCLFEGTFRKYHSDLDLENTANDWLTEASDAAKEVMESGLYTIHENASEPSESYKELFLDRSGTPPSDEIILAKVASSSLSVLHDATWIFTSPTNGLQPSFVKQFINTYLNLDGTAFTDQADFNKIPFVDEVQDRDYRLSQTIRMKGYTRENGAQPPNWSYTNTGYQPIKFTLYETFADGSSVSDNSIPVIRFGEVLLNYAEAKAELGSLNQSDWEATIGKLRHRAGLANSNVMPTSADVYLMDTFYKGITDPIVLEVRRERAIELALEGFRFRDLLRWKLGKNMEMPWMGMYVESLDKLYDLNEDGTPEVSFVKETPGNKQPGVVYRTVDDVVFKLSEGDHGNIIFHDDFNRTWEDKNYLYPIPRQETVLNPNLGQNPGWEE